MKEEEVLMILKNIYGTLNYNDWMHAREYVKLEIERLEKIMKENISLQ